MSEPTMMVALVWMLTLIAAAILGYVIARPLSARKASADQKRRIEQLSVLNEVGRALSSSLRLDELLERIYQQISRLIDATHYFVALYDPASDVISFPLAKERGQPWNVPPRRAADGLTEYVIRTRQPLLIARDANQRMQDLGLSQIGQPTRCWLGVPMISGDQLIGVISVQNVDREGVYDQEQLELLQTIAAQAAVAVVNARLYERTDLTLARRVDELAARNRQLSNILQLGRLLKSNLELQDLLDQVVKTVVETLGFNIALLNLVEPGTPPTVRRVASAGLPADVWEQMKNAVFPLDETLQVMRPEFRISQSYFISHRYPEVWQNVDSYVPDLGPRGEGEWSAEDALLVPLTDSSGQLIGILSMDDPVDRNIPTRETIEVLEVFANQASVAIENARLFQRLAEGRDRLQAILDATRDGMLMVDTVGRIVVVNNMSRELFRVSPDQLQGRRLVDLLNLLGETSAHTALLDAIYEVLNELAEQSTRITRETMLLSDPHRIIDRLSVPVVDASGASIGRLLVLRDVTEERDAQALREDLTRMMIHDLRSPMTNILGSLELLQDTVGEHPENQQLVTLAHSSGTRLLKMINSLLDISRLEAGQMPLNRQPMRWNWPVQTAQERLSAVAAKAGVTLQVSAAPDLPEVEADGEVILRVLLNLMDNAIQFSSSGASVSVSANWTADRQATECRVQDHGPGIPSDYRNRVFDKFIQVPRPRRKKGTGLGLAFSRLAVEAHGGRIWVEDTPGGGSTFVFTLPLAR